MQTSGSGVGVGSGEGFGQGNRCAATGEFPQIVVVLPQRQGP